MLLDKKSQFFLYLDLVKIRLEITLNNFVKKKKLFSLENKNLLESPKNGFFPKGLTHAFGQKMLIFFVYVDLVKIWLEIMLSDFPQKKRNLLNYKKQNFSKGFNPGFSSKKPNSFLVRFGHNKTRKTA